MALISERCPCCGSPPTLSHLQNCKIMLREKGGDNVKLATIYQLDFLKDLCKQLGYSFEYYKPHELTLAKARTLIKELEKEARR